MEGFLASHQAVGNFGRDKHATDRIADGFASGGCRLAAGSRITPPAAPFIRSAKKSSQGLHQGPQDPNQKDQVDEGTE